MTPPDQSRDEAIAGSPLHQAVNMGLLNDIQGPLAEVLKAKGYDFDLGLVSHTVILRTYRISGV